MSVRYSPESNTGFMAVFQQSEFQSLSLIHPARDMRRAISYISQQLNQLIAMFMLRGYIDIKGKITFQIGKYAFQLFF